MSLHTTVHLHNVSQGREPEYARWFEGAHRKGLSGLRGFRAADRYELADAQIMPDIRQPWRFLSVYDFDVTGPAIDIPALGSLIAEARSAGLIVEDETERLYTYRMYSDWRFSENWRRDEPFSGINIILANYVPGCREEYQRYYDEVHAGEVTGVPGNVGMRRGEYASVQVEPRHFCPAEQLIMGAQQTDDLLFTIRDFSARFGGRSPSGIAMGPRSASASVARTVHYFQKISGENFWRTGIAYAGDLSVYPGKS